MSEDEFDVSEYARQLEYTQELGIGDLSRPATSEDDAGGLTRRDLLVKGGVGAAAVAGLGSLAGSAAAATSKAGKFTGTLRVLSLGVEWPQGVQQQAEKDLGFKFKVDLVGSGAQPQIAITNPERFDVYGGYNYQTLLIWPSGNLQPIDTQKIPTWNQFYKLFSHGKVNPASQVCTFGQGNAPFRVTYVDPDGSTGLPAFASGPASNKQVIRWIGENGKPIGGKPQPRWIVGPAAHFNADSMGYNSEVVQKRPNQVSWAELLNKKWKGRVALLRDPGIMAQDAAFAVQQLGLMKFKDFGNPTKAEISRLFKIMGTYKKQGQFRAFWDQFPDSVNLMQSKEVVLESMWSPAVALLKAAGVPVLYAAPPEGFRGWCSATGISAKVTDPARLQACYDYINWMYTGFLGAAIMRQGYYIANGTKLPGWIRSDQGKAFGFTSAEYDYWWGGKTAPRDLPGITGKVGDVKGGTAREGGAFNKRICRYRSWNSYPREAVFLVTTVNNFLA